MRIDPYAIVLAGGRGSRLPIAGSIPKQFAPKFDGITFVQDVVRMITSGAIKPSRVIVVVTSDEQAEFAKKQLTPYRVPSPNIVKFNPHYGYVAVMAAAADYIRSFANDPNAVVFITPSDSHIEGEEELTRAIRTSCEAAAKGRPVLIGAKVADANIVGGCGNALYDATAEGPFYKILDFIEKPIRYGMDKVTQILRDDNTVVNTGLYAVRIERFCKMYPIEKLDALLERFEEEKPIGKSDLGLDPTEMVKKLNMRLMIGDFHWKDCGTLDAYYSIQKKTPNHHNASIGQVTRRFCLDSLFVSSTRGVHIFATYIKEQVAVLTFMRSKDELDIAIVNMGMSQFVGQITDFFENGGEAMSCQIHAINNFVIPGNLAGIIKVRVAFLGVQNIYACTNRQDNGDIDVIVSANGECIYDGD